MKCNAGCCNEKGTHRFKNDKKLYCESCASSFACSYGHKNKTPLENLEMLFSYEGGEE